MLYFYGLSKTNTNQQRGGRAQQTTQYREEIEAKSQWKIQKGYNIIIALKAFKGAAEYNDVVGCVYAL